MFLLLLYFLTSERLKFLSIPLVTYYGTFRSAGKDFLFIQSSFLSPLVKDLAYRTR